MKRWIWNGTPKIMRFLSSLICLGLIHSVSAEPIASQQVENDHRVSSKTQEVELVDSARAAWLNLLHNEKHFGSPGYIYAWPDSGSPGGETLRLPFETGQPAQLEVIQATSSRSFKGELLRPKITPVQFY